MRRRVYTVRFEDHGPDWSLRGLVYRLAVNALALAAAAAIVPGIEVGDWQSLLAGSALFALVNALLRPIAYFFSACLILLTFGLFVIVVNAAMLGITAWAAGGLGLNLRVDGFWSALFGALVISLISLLANALVRRRRG